MAMNVYKWYDVPHFVGVCNQSIIIDGKWERNSALVDYVEKQGDLLVLNIYGFNQYVDPEVDGSSIHAGMLFVMTLYEDSSRSKQAVIHIEDPVTPALWDKTISIANEISADAGDSADLYLVFSQSVRKYDMQQVYPDSK